MFVCLIAAVALSGQHRHHATHHAMKPAKPVDEEKAIRATAKMVETAFETKNMKLFGSLLTADMKQESPDGKVIDKKEALAMMRSQLQPVSDIKAEVNLLDIKVMGAKAEVMDRFTMSGKMTDKKGKHNMKVLGSETVSLRKVGGKWLCYYDKVHDQSVSIDGHVVSHMP